MKGCTNSCKFPGRLPLHGSMSMGTMSLSGSKIVRSKTGSMQKSVLCSAFRAELNACKLLNIAASQRLKYPSCSFSCFCHVLLIEGTCWLPALRKHICGEDEPEALRLCDCNLLPHAVMSVSLIPIMQRAQ